MKQESQAPQSKYHSTQVKKKYKLVYGPHTRIVTAFVAEENTWVSSLEPLQISHFWTQWVNNAICQIYIETYSLAVCTFVNIFRCLEFFKQTLVE